jgi:hypothetical protein
MDREERRKAFERFLEALEPVQAAYRDWRVSFEAESSAAFASLDYDMRLKIVFHVFRMLAHDVRSYRVLIYDKLGFGMDAYSVLFDGLAINNALVTERDRATADEEPDEDVEAAQEALDEYRDRGGEDAATWFDELKRHSGRDGPNPSGKAPDP